MNTISKIDSNERTILMKEMSLVQTKIEELNHIIGDDGYEKLLDGISQQRWYGFKNKREIVFDSHTGYLFPNFEYIPHIKYSEWDKEKRKYAPNDIEVGLWTHLGSIFQRYKDNQYYDYSETEFSYPIKFSGAKQVYMYLYDRGGNYNNVCFSNFYKKGNLKTDSRASIADDIKVFPLIRVLKNDGLLPDYPRLTKFEKAKIILEFFLIKNWIPLFELHLIPKRYEDSDFFNFENTKSYKRYSGQLNNLDFIDGEDDEEFQERIAQIEKVFEQYNQIFNAYY